MNDINVAAGCREHRPFLDVNILSFSYFILKQSEDSVPMFSNKIMHFGGLEKLLDALAFQIKTTKQIFTTSVNKNRKYNLQLSNRTDSFHFI